MISFKFGLQFTALLDNSEENLKEKKKYTKFHKKLLLALQNKYLFISLHKKLNFFWKKKSAIVY